MYVQDQQLSPSFPPYVAWLHVQLQGGTPPLPMAEALFVTDAGTPGVGHAPPPPPATASGAEHDVHNTEPPPPPPPRPPDGAGEPAHPTTAVNTVGAGVRYVPVTIAPGAPTNRPLEPPEAPATVTFTKTPAGIVIDCCTPLPTQRSSARPAGWPARKSGPQTQSS